jgi:hypothetical protein
MINTVDVPAARATILDRHRFDAVKFATQSGCYRKRVDGSESS